MALCRVTSSQIFHDFQNLPAIPTVVDIYPLHPNDALGVNDHKPHLGDAGHATHWLTAFWQEIVLAGNLQIFIIQNGQGRLADLPHLSCLCWKVAVDRVDFSLIL